MDDKKNNIVKKANALISARCKLGINEQKILYKIISCIHINDKDFKDYEIKVVDIIHFLDTKSQNNYIELKKYIKNLMRELLIFEEDGKEIHTHWLSLAEYGEDKKTIMFNFHPRLKASLIDLQGRFTSFGLENIRQFRSKYSPRIYEMLKQYEDTQFKIIKVLKLRKILSLEDKYKKYNDFKKNVLLIPQQEINETDISFTFKEIKEGRTVDKISFHIKSKKNDDVSSNQESPEKLSEIDKINLLNENVNEIKAKIKKVIDDEVKRPKIIEWIEKGKEEDINFYLENWSKWSWKNKMTRSGFFIDLVDNKRDLPKQEKGHIKPVQSTNYEQRKYNDEFFDNLYDNIQYIK